MKTSIVSRGIIHHRALPRTYPECALVCHAFPHGARCGQPAPSVARFSAQSRECSVKMQCEIAIRGRHSWPSAEKRPPALRSVARPRNGPNHQLPLPPPPPPPPENPPPPKALPPPKPVPPAPAEEATGVAADVRLLVKNDVLKAVIG